MELDPLAVVGRVLMKAGDNVNVSMSYVWHFLFSACSCLRWFVTC
jgi:hypothetical protein